MKTGIVYGVLSNLELIILGLFILYVIFDKIKSEIENKTSLTKHNRSLNFVYLIIPCVLLVSSQILTTENYSNFQKDLQKSENISSFTLLDSHYTEVLCTPSFSHTSKSASWLTSTGKREYGTLVGVSDGKQCVYRLLTIETTE